MTPKALTSRKEQVKLMGQPVTVLATLKKRFIYEDRHKVVKHEISMLTEPRAGWIVGFTYRLDGYVLHDYEGSSEFRERSRQMVVLVSFYPGLKPVSVPPNQLHYGHVNGRAPRSSSPKWTDRAKRELSNIMKTAKRDSRGRWVR